MRNNFDFEEQFDLYFGKRLDDLKEQMQQFPPDKQKTIFSFLCYSRSYYLAHWDLYLNSNLPVREHYLHFFDSFCDFIPAHLKDKKKKPVDFKHSYGYAPYIEDENIGYESMDFLINFFETFRQERDKKAILESLGHSEDSQSGNKKRRM